MHMQVTKFYKAVVGIGRQISFKVQNPLELATHKRNFLEHIILNKLISSVTHTHTHTFIMINHTRKKKSG